VAGRRRSKGDAVAEFRQEGLKFIGAALDVTDDVERAGVMAPVGSQHAVG
jgi:hypothetical protein